MGGLHNSERDIRTASGHQTNLVYTQYTLTQTHPLSIRNHTVVDISLEHMHMIIYSSLTIATDAYHVKQGMCYQLI